MKPAAESVDIKTRPAQCEKHGEFESRNFIGSVWSKCPKCAAEAQAAEREAEELKAREEKRRAWEMRLGASGIPERFHDRTLNTYVATTDAQREALQFATEYADNFSDAARTGRSVIFCGRPGTGKTHLAAGIGLRLMHRDRRPVLFTTVMRAVRRVKETWGRSSTETESQAIAAMVFPDLLILDEVGVQFGSDTERLILFDVLNERYERRRPTLLLSNLTVDGVREFLGERIFDRLREDGGRAIVFDWQSHRGTK